MAAGTLISLQEYEHTTYEPDMEYVDGLLVGRNVGSQMHSLLQASLCIYLSRFRDSANIKIFTEARMRIGDRYRIPDVTVLEVPYTKGKVITDIPAAVFEIMSPDDSLGEVVEKCLEYAAMGVANIVVLDPDHQRQYVFADNALKIVSNITIKLPKSGASLPLPMDELFAEL